MSQYALAETRARIDKYHEWMAEVKAAPDSYKIIPIVVKDNYVDVGLYQNINKQWVLVEALPRWFFNAEN
jgi:hypothetical protein